MWKRRGHSPGDPSARELGWVRLRWVAGLGALLWLGLAARLVQVQGLQRQEYARRAREQHERRVELKARRGSILDRRGNELALDLRAASFYADPLRVEHPEEIARHFAPFGQQPAAALERQLRSSRRFVYLARQLDEAAAARARSRSFRGVFEYPETRRYYPYGHLAGQLLGFASIDDEGLEGLERAFDGWLGARRGEALSYVDARGAQVPGRRRAHTAPQDGCDLVLTLDAVYQDILEEELQHAVKNSEAESAVGLLSDPRSGEILAMASVPLYDPNDPGASPPRRRRNRAITDAFEPGSTFKVIAAAAVLEEGLATLDERVFCEEGRLVLENGDLIRDTRPHGWLSFREVMEKSSNIGMIKLTRRLQRQAFYEYMRRFGFGTRSGIGLPAESAGLLRHASEWSERSLETMAIGQEISTTALQLVQALGAVANGGILMAPQIAKKIVAPDGRVVESMRPQPIRRVISQATAATMRGVLEGVVQRGTGRRARIEGVAIAGKTGTAQRAAAGGYAENETTVSFVGFLPAAAPELLCLVVIDNPQKDRWGGHLAAPAFKRIMERILFLRDGFVAAVPARTARLDPPLIETPDLRGMHRDLADFQAELRGLKVSFAGAGELVVAQKPSPGAAAGVARRISCLLGDPGSVPEAELENMPRRQALLLQNLRRARPAARP